MNDAPGTLAAGSPALWLRAIRPFSFTASAIPVFVAVCASWFAGHDVAWPLLAPTLLAAIAVHGGTNLFNDTHDFRRGVDREGTLGGSGLLVSGELRPGSTQKAALLCFALAAALGVWFVMLRGWPVALVGALGLAGGYAYTGRPVGYKYRALGDLMVFVLMGPLMVVGADLVLTGAFHPAAIWLGLPVGLLVMSILHGNNLRDLGDDERSGFVTVAMLLGAPRSRAWYAVMVAAAFVAVAALIALAVLPVYSAAVALAAPAAGKNIRRVLRHRADSADRLADIDVQSAQTHALFGVLLCLSLVVGALV
ncbi:MAG: prenyltransferase [Deltaproteobacteria bacterium]|jgi:1,4-dihydroxy-2-naphthoate octaprenyltransferase|nr:prenyltransferase [Deltaproteobacteria bacterium]MBW2533297.1 prenyltransferase [Deltaproteobacteria bacterium]